MLSPQSGTGKRLQGGRCESTQRMRSTGHWETSGMMDFARIHGEQGWGARQKDWILLCKDYKENIHNYGLSMSGSCRAHAELRSGM